MSLAIGDAGAGFRLPTTDGGEASLEELAGSPAVVVAFWCNHCPYVRAWEERFNDIAREYADRGVATVAVCANDAVSHPGDSFEAWPSRAAERGLHVRLRPRRLPGDRPGLRRRAHARRSSCSTARGGSRTTARSTTAPTEAAVTAPYLREALDAVLAGRPPAGPRRRRRLHHQVAALSRRRRRGCSRAAGRCPRAPSSTTRPTRIVWSPPSSAEWRSQTSRATPKGSSGAPKGPASSG